MMPTGGPGAPGWPGSWMTVSDVFHIRGRGTVVTGQLQGDVPLNIGDTLVYEGTRWQVSGIEQFRSTLMTAMPGSDIGVLLKMGPPADVLRGQTVTFEPGTPGGSPLLDLQPRKRRWRR
jgi:translation elongation factor EF-Tu-like GTPase